MLNHYNTTHAIELLQLDFDGSECNRHSRNRAKKYLSDLRDSLVQFRDKKPDSRVARRVQLKINEYEEILERSK